MKFVAKKCMSLFVLSETISCGLTTMSRLSPVHLSVFPFFTASTNLAI